MAACEEQTQAVICYGEQQYNGSPKTAEQHPNAGGEIDSTRRAGVDWGRGGVRGQYEKVVGPVPNV